MIQFQSRPWIQSESEEVASQEEQTAEEPVSTTTTSSEQPRSEKYGAVTPMLKKFLESATSTAADQVWNPTITVYC